MVPPVIYWFVSCNVNHQLPFNLFGSLLRGFFRWVCCLWQLVEFLSVLLPWAIQYFLRASPPLTMSLASVCIPKFKFLYRSSMKFLVTACIDVCTGVLSIPFEVSAHVFAHYWSDTWVVYSWFTFNSYLFITPPN